MTGSVLAMHMGNELLSVPVAAATLVLAAGAVALAAVRSRRALDAEKLPLMGVMGAFVFAAQMINFPLPGLGTSGHLGGGVLLAILLGPAPAIVTMAGILIVQCLLFQDGGLLALGCNIINMGVVPCLLGWGVYRLMGGGSPRAGAARQYLAAWAACLAGVTFGAALVPFQAALSGILRVPLTEFLAVMVGLHLLIALGEGLITFAVLAYLRRTRPAVLGLEPSPRAQRLSRPALAGSLVATALLVAGLLSALASEYPDGLEAAWEGLTHKYAAQSGEGESAAPPADAMARAAAAQERWTLMPDYQWSVGWVSLAGIIGTGATLVLVFGVSRVLGRRD